MFSFRTIDKSNFKSIVHIAAIPKSESINVHLVAITSSGESIPNNLLFLALCLKLTVFVIVPELRVIKQHQSVDYINSSAVSGSSKPYFLCAEERMFTKVHLSAGSN